MHPLRIVTALGLASLAAAGTLVMIGGYEHTDLPDAAPLPPTPTATSPQSRSAPATIQVPEHQAGMARSSIRIPALGITAAIGWAAQENGVLIPPSSPSEVGLWNGSASLDARTGEVTIAGHVHWAGRPVSFAFGRLAYLHAGDLVYTSDAHSGQTAWRITRVTARSKSQGIDPAGFLGPNGPRQLVLITCGGPFDASSSSYDDNVYAYATPA